MKLIQYKISMEMEKLLERVVKEKEYPSVSEFVRVAIYERLNKFSRLKNQLKM